MDGSQIHGNPSGDNVEDLNSSSFLDSSNAAQKYEICTGPVSDGEKAYLLRHGLALEDSRGELYGEPSTIIDFEDSLVEVAETQATPRKPTPANESLSQNRELRRSSRKSRATTPCISCRMDSLHMSTIENQMSNLTLHDQTEGTSEDCGQHSQQAENTQKTDSFLTAKDSSHLTPINSPVCKTTPKRASKKFNLDASSSLTQSGRLTRSGVKRNIEMMASLNLEDQMNEEDERKQMTFPAIAMSPMVDPEIGDDNDKGASSVDHLEKQTKDETAFNLSASIAPNCSNKSYDKNITDVGLDDQLMDEGIAAGKTCTPGTSSAQEQEVTVTEPDQETQIIKDHDHVEQNAPTPIHVNPNGANFEINGSDSGNTSANRLTESPVTKTPNLENVSCNLFDDSSSSSGEEFDDTITRMEKILAMADEQEQAPNVPTLENSKMDKKVETPAKMELHSSERKPSGTNLGSRVHAPTPVSLAKHAVRGGIFQQTPSPAPSVRVKIPNGSAGNRTTPLPNWAQGATISSKQRTPVSVRPKTPASGQGSKTPFVVQSPRPLVGTVKPNSQSPVVARTPTKTGTGSEMKLTPVGSGHRKDTPGDARAGSAGFKAPLPPLSSPPYRGKKDVYFKSPGLTPGQSNSTSTPLRLFTTETQTIQETIASPVSSIHPSPVAKLVRRAPNSVKSAMPVPVPVQVQKLLKEKVPSPLDMLKKTYKKGVNAVSSPVAEYIYSTPTPTRIQRVVKTSENSNEKRPPFRAGGPSHSLPRRSFIPRLAPFKGSGTAFCGEANLANPIKVLKESTQNQLLDGQTQASAPGSNVDEVKQQPRILRPVEYHGSDKIREHLYPFDAAGAPKGYDIKVQRHKGIVDENTNATIVEDELVNKAFIPARLKNN